MPLEEQGFPLLAGWSWHLRSVGSDCPERDTAHPMRPSIHLSVRLRASGPESHMHSPSGLQEVGNVGGQAGVAAGTSGSLVQWALEYEADAAVLTGKPSPTEGTGGVESVGAVGQWCLGPIAGSLLRTHVAAGSKGMAGRPRVQTEAGLLAEPQGHIGPHEAAEGTLAFLGTLLPSAAPTMVAVDVAAADIDPGLLLVGCGAAPGRAGEGQGAEAYGALGPGCVGLLPLGL